MKALTHGPMTRRPSTWLALVLLALALFMVAFSVVSVALPDYDQLPTSGAGLELATGVIVISLAFTTVPLTGALLAIKRPQDPIGWLLLIGMTMIIFGLFSVEYVQRSVVLGWDLPAYRIVDWMLVPMEIFGFLLLVIWIPLLFPDGLLPGRSWRLVAWMVVLVTSVLVAGTVLTIEVSETGPFLPNPVAVSESARNVIEVVLELALVGVALLVTVTLASVVLRYRRAQPIQRLQLKWFISAVALVVMALAALAVTGSAWAYLATVATFTLVPIAIGIAVLRYRLYEIDRLISRTIGWALVTGLLVGTFALLVLGSSAVLEPLTGGNTLAVAGSTLIVALLFTPVRSRVQGSVDRRFDRSRYDGERTLEAFGERLRDEVDLPTIRADVLATVGNSVRPTRVGLWLRTPGGER